jgi:hypothetical protein
VDALARLERKTESDLVRIARKTYEVHPTVDPQRPVRQPFEILPGVVCLERNAPRNDNAADPIVT